MALPGDTILARLKTAITRAVLPKSWEPKVDQFAEWMSRCWAWHQYQTAGATDGARAGRSVGTLVETIPAGSRLDQHEEMLVAEILTKHPSGSDEFWLSLDASGIPGAKATALKRTLALESLTDGEVGLIRALQPLIPDHADDGIAQLATLSRRQWFEVVAQTVTDSARIGDIETLVLKLERRVAQAHPMVALQARLTDGSFKKIEFPADAVANVLKSAPNLDLKSTDIEPFLIRNKIEVDDSTRKALLQIQRVTRLGATAGEVVTLLGRRFSDAGQIAQYHREAFVNAVKSDLGEDRAAELHFMAQQQAAALIMTASLTLPAFQRSQLPAMGVPLAATAGNNAAIKTFPSLQLLFGDQSYCECEHCNSVLSPAAYLVDLLRTLSTHGGEYVLRWRRPDIAELWLTCENTNTELPYVDLVLEILENAVTFPGAVTTLTGADMAQLDAGTVPAFLRTELQKTSREVLGTLEVQTTPRPTRTSQQGVPLRIRHRYALWIGRRWFSELTAAWVPGTQLPSQSTGPTPQFFTIPEAQRAAWLASLQAGTVPAGLLAAIAPEAILPVIGTPVLRVLSAPAPATAGSQLWQTSITRSVVVEVVLGGAVGALRFYDRSGKLLSDQQVQPGSLVQAVAAALAQNQVNAYLATYLPNAPYTVVADTAPRRYILTATFTAVVAESADAVQMEGLVYNSSTPGEDHTVVAEYRNPEAYRMLSAAVYPLDLPFDVFVEEVRSCAQTLGVSRLELMRLLRSLPTAKYTTRPEAIEELQTNDTLLGLLAEGAPTNARAAALWGLQENGSALVDPLGDANAKPIPTDWRGALSRLSVLLDRSRLEPRQLLAVFGLKYLAALTPLPVFSPEGECKPSRVTVLGLNKDHLVRLLQIVRLVTLTRWSLRDLDAALVAVGGGAAITTEPQVIALAGIAALVKGTGVSVRTVALWLGLPEIWRYTDQEAEGAPELPSHYEEVFRRNGLNQRPDPDFDLDVAKSELAYITRQTGAVTYRTLTEKLPLLSAALRVPAADLAALIGTGAAVLIDDKLTFANLRTLWQHASLAKALGTTVLELNVFRCGVGFRYFGDRSDTPPAVIDRPKLLRDFLEVIGDFRAARLTADEVAWLTGQRRVDLNAQRNQSLARLAWLRQVQSSLNERRTPPEQEVPESALRALCGEAGWPASLVNRLIGGHGAQLGLTSTPDIAIEYPATTLPTLPTGQPFLASRIANNQVRIALTQPFGDAAAANEAFTALAAVTGLGPLTTPTSPAARLQAAWSSLVSDSTDVVQILQSIELPQSSQPLKFHVKEPIGVSTNFRIPDRLSEQVRYTSGQPLAIDGFLNATQLSMLKALISGATNASTVSTELDRLLGPPPALAQSDSPLRYDSASRTLRLIGYLSASEVSALRGLSTAPEFATAVTALVAANQAFVEHRPGQQLLGWIDVLSLFVTTASVYERFARVCNAMMAPLRRQRALRLAAGRAGIDLALLSALDTAAQLATPSRDALAALTSDTFAALTIGTDPDDPALGAAMDAIDAIEQCGLVCQRLVLNGLHARWFDAIVGFAGLPALALGEPAAATTTGRFDPLRSVVHLIHIRRLLGDSTEAMERVRQASQVSLSQSLTTLEAHCHVRDGDMAIALAVEGRITQGAQLRTPADFRGVVAIADVLRRLRVPANSLISISKVTLDEPETANARAAVVTRFGETGADEALRVSMNRLRERQRTALTSYLRFRDQVSSPSELFGLYLLDVDMGPDMLTSRLKQAISSTQLFMQRLLMNLESVELGRERDGLARMWPWFKSYRLWEANRKVFLYPENWLDWSLYEGKTPLLRQLESDVTQSDLTIDRAISLFQNYLSDLGDLSRLSIRSMFQENAGDGSRLIHIVARSADHPYHYYYRQWTIVDTSRSWTPWEPVSTVASSEHVACFMLRGQVHIAWLQVSRAGDDNLAAGAQASWNVELQWTSRGKDGWKAPRKWNDRLSVLMLVNKTESVSFALRVVEVAGYSRVRLYVAEDPAGPLQTLEAWDQGVNISANKTRQQRLLARHTLRVQVIGEFHGANETVYLARNDATIEVWGSSYIRGDDGQGTIVGASSNWGTAQQPNAVPVQNGVASTTLISNQPNLGSIGGAPILYTVISMTLQLHVRVSVPDDPVAQQFDLTEDDLMPTVDNLVSIGVRFKIPNNAPRFSPYRAVRMMPAKEFSWMSGLGVEALDSTESSELVPEFDRTTHESSGLREDINGSDFRWQGLALALKTDPIDPIYLTYKGQFFGIASGGTGRTSYADPLYLEEAGRNAFFFKDSRGVWHVMPGGEFLYSRTRLALAQAPTDQLVVGTQDIQSIRTAYLDVLRADALRDLDDDLCDFAMWYPTANYTWEIFFYIPMILAKAFALQQKPAQAMMCMHLVFDPTRPTVAVVPGTTAPNYWQFRPFAHLGAGQSIDDLLTALAKGQNPPGLKAQIDFSRSQPFRPHGIARLRPRANQWATVFQYLDMLIAWGDQLFARDTLESINEATQLYLLAADLIGRRPQVMPPPRRRTVSGPSYASLEDKWDDFSNAWVSLGDLPFFRVLLADAENLIKNGVTVGEITQSQLDQMHNILSLGSLVFCIPPNDRITSYWDTIEDRLFKIRNSQNIDGITRTLPLFEPPIDPALLVRAVAMGMDVTQLMNEAFAPPSHYRFPVALQRAMELTNEVKALGAGLLAAREKRDAEYLSGLRSTQEVALLEHLSEIKRRQRDQAEAEQRVTRQSRQTAELRYRHYQRLLGKDEIVVPAEQERVTLDQARLRLAGSGDSVDPSLRGFGLSVEESDQLTWLAEGNTASLIGNGFMIAAGIAHAFPQITTGGPPPYPQATYGGQNVGLALNAVGQAAQMLGSYANFQGGRSGMIASHQRRYDDWVMQSNLAARELAQIDRQILVGDIRVDLAKKELDQHEMQLANARQMDEFLQTKFTRTELYSWMKDQLRELHRTAYQLAYQYAKRAEQSLAFELGITRPGIIRFGAWEEVREGLLAGERLSIDLRRLEAMYLDRNVRELEITKHVPLSQINPLALVQLRANGQCTFKIPEELYDLDFPGHYFRRIKSVSITLPCVAGPYTSISGTLTLQSNRMRAVSTVTAYDYTGIDDPNFIHDLMPVQAIATSSAQNDAGLFEFNFRDERYLPFEGAGAISDWRFELPSEFRQFDYSTISDVILHVKYTARDGGQGLRSLASGHLRQVLSQQVQVASDEQRLARALGIRHEYPVEWAKLASAATGVEQALIIDVSRLPYFLSQASVSIVKVTVVVQPSPNVAVNGDWVSLKPPAAAWLTKDAMTDLPVTRVMETAELVTDEFDFTQQPGGEAWTDWTPFDLQPDANHTQWSLALQRSATDINDMAIVVWLRVGS